MTTANSKTVLLDGGAHDPHERKACVMELTNMIYLEQLGIPVNIETWTDLPDCVPPRLSLICQRFNDAASKSKRQDFKGLAPRMVGLTSYTDEHPMKFQFFMRQLEKMAVQEYEVIWTHHKERCGYIKQNRDPLMKKLEWDVEKVRYHAEMDALVDKALKVIDDFLPDTTVEIEFVTKVVDKYLDREEELALA